MSHWFSIAEMSSVESIYMRKQNLIFRWVAYAGVVRFSKKTRENLNILTAIINKSEYKTPLNFFKSKKKE